MWNKIKCFPLRTQREEPNNSEDDDSGGLRLPKPHPRSHRWLTAVSMETGCSKPVFSTWACFDFLYSSVNSIKLIPHNSPCWLMLLFSVEQLTEGKTSSSHQQGVNSKLLASCAVVHPSYTYTGTMLCQCILLTRILIALLVSNNSSIPAIIAVQCDGYWYCLWHLDIDNL